MFVYVGLNRHEGVKFRWDLHSKSNELDMDEVQSKLVSSISKVIEKYLIDGFNRNRESFMDNRSIVEFNCQMDSVNTFGKILRDSLAIKVLSQLEKDLTHSGYYLSLYYDNKDNSFGSLIIHKRSIDSLFRYREIDNNPLSLDSELEYDISERLELKIFSKGSYSLSEKNSEKGLSYFINPFNWFK